MKRQVYTYLIILLVMLIYLFIQINCYAAINPLFTEKSLLFPLQIPYINYGIGVSPIVGPLNLGNPSSLFSDVTHYNPSLIFAGAYDPYRAGQANTSDKIIRTGPGSIIQNLNWGPFGYSVNSFGLVNTLDPVSVSNFVFPGIGYHPLGFSVPGFPGIGNSLTDIQTPGFAGIGFPTGPGFSIPYSPGLGYFEIDSSGLGYAPPIFSGVGFGGRGIPGYIPLQTILNPPLGEVFAVAGYNPLIQVPPEFDINSLPNTLKSLIPSLPVNLGTAQFTHIPIDLTSRMYVAVTIQGLDQTIYVLLNDNGQDPNQSLEDILRDGIHCIRVKDISNVQDPYTIKYGQACYILSLYLEATTLTPVWAWDCKWWHKN